MLPRLPCRPGSTPWLHGGAKLYATSQSPGLRLGAFMAGTVRAEHHCHSGVREIKAPGASPGTAGLNATDVCHAARGPRRGCMAAQRVTQGHNPPACAWGLLWPSQPRAEHHCHSGVREIKAPGASPGTAGLNATDVCHAARGPRRGCMATQGFTQRHNPPACARGFYGRTSSRVCDAYEWAQGCNTGDPGGGGCLPSSGFFWRAGGMPPVPAHHRV